MEIVRFKNGRYAVRRRHLFFGYRYLSASGNWWERHSLFFSNCMFDEDEAKKRFADWQDFGTPVKEGSI